MNTSLTDTINLADCRIVFFFPIKLIAPVAPPIPAPTPTPRIAPPPTIAIVPPAMPSPPAAIAPPPKYARQALVKAAPLNPAKFDPTKATAIGEANAPAVAIVTIATPAVIVIDVMAVLSTSFISRQTLS